MKNVRLPSKLLFALMLMLLGCSNDGAVTPQQQGDHSEALSRNPTSARGGPITPQVTCEYPRVWNIPCPIVYGQRYLANGFNFDFPLEVVLPSFPGYGTNSATTITFKVVNTATTAGGYIPLPIQWRTSEGSTPWNYLAPGAYAYFTYPIPAGDGTCVLPHPRVKVWTKRTSCPAAGFKSWAVEVQLNGATNGHTIEPYCTANFGQYFNDCSYIP